MVKESLLDTQMGERFPLRILLTEDNPMNQKLVLQVLTRLGYQPDLASNGLEAIEALEDHTYDVILMDIQMPKMDGLEATKQIRHRWPGDQGPKIVAMTANGTLGARQEYLAAGMDEYIGKPIRLENLVNVLKQCGTTE